MKILSLKINGLAVDGLDNATVKITINNVSPVTMTGDSVAFSASIKVPRSPGNDVVFMGLNKGLFNCEYYVAELQVSSIPFSYMSYVNSTPSEFYAKVSASQTEYTINLIDSMDKWADVSLPISAPPVFKAANVIGASAADLYELIDRYTLLAQPSLPAINPEYISSVSAPDAEFQVPTIICKRSELNWQNDVATGSTKFVPQKYSKGRGGYIYPRKATVIMDNSTIYRNASYFGDRPGGAPAGILIASGKGQAFYLIVEYVGDTIPATKPPIQLQGNVSGLGRSVSFAGEISERIWVYRSIANQQMTVYPKQDTFIELAANINGVPSTEYFKFPDGYAPDEVVKCGAGNVVYDEAIAPASQLIHNKPVGFPYSDVKKLVDDLCTAFQWRKLYKNGTLKIEPIVNANLRDGVTTIHDNIHDWSDKLLSVESVDVPDEFADQYVCTLDQTQFSYSNGRGSVTPVKEAFKSGIKFSRDTYGWPKLALTSVFTASFPDADPGNIEDMYYNYIGRHFDMFKSRVQVKVKARLGYEDVENLRLGDAYYFSQLNSYFYIKSLGEFDVATGNCKLSLYKMDLK